VTTTKVSHCGSYITRQTIAERILVAELCLDMSSSVHWPSWALTQNHACMWDSPQVISIHTGHQRVRACEFKLRARTAEEVCMMQRAWCWKSACAAE
jgi:hypothetical protein